MFNTQQFWQSVGAIPRSSSLICSSVGLLCFLASSSGDWQASDSLALRKLEFPRPRWSSLHLFIDLSSFCIVSHLASHMFTPMCSFWLLSPLPSFLTHIMCPWQFSVTLFLNTIYIHYFLLHMPYSAKFPLEEIHGQDLFLTSSIFIP